MPASFPICFVENAEADFHGKFPWQLESICNRMEASKIMGLEHVEIGLRIEKEFGVCVFSEPRFPETVGALHRVIRKALNQKLSIATCECPCIPAFFKVRDTLLAIHGSHERIRPSTPLNDLLPQRRRRKNWNAMARQLASDLPQLRIDPRFEGPIILGWLGACLFSLLAGHLAAGSAGLLLSTIVVLPSITMLAYFFLRKSPALVPAECSTVEHLVRRILPTPQAINAGTRTDDYNWRLLVQIVSDELDVPLDEIRDESHFVRDLKCD